MDKFTKTYVATCGAVSIWAIVSDRVGIDGAAFWMGVASVVMFVLGLMGCAAPVTTGTELRARYGEPAKIVAECRSGDSVKWQIVEYRFRDASRARFMVNGNRITYSNWW